MKFLTIKFNVRIKNKAKNSLFNTCLNAICSFVGVGFITGAEIWFYFARFGFAEIFGLIVFGVLTFFLIMFSFQQNETSFEKTNNFKVIVSGLSEMLVASAMVSGLSETAKTLFGKWWIVVFFISIFMLAMLLFLGAKSFSIYNYFVASFVFFVIISLFLFNNNSTTQNLPIETIKFDLKNIFSSCLFAGIYIFMNISEIRPVLTNFEGKNSKKMKVILSLILSLSLIFLVITISIVLLKNTELTQSSMPFLSFFKSKDGVLLWLFLIGIVLTMISTAEACLIGVKDKLKFLKNEEKFTKTIVILISLILGQISFSFFIKVIYPIIAIFNFLLFFREVFERKIFTKSKTFKI